MARKRKSEAVAELSRLMGKSGLEVCKGYRDADRILEHSVACMVRFSQGQDRLAFDAAQWLVGYAQRLKLEQESAAAAPLVEPANERLVIAELRSLYAHALESPARAAELVEIEATEPD